MSNRIEIAVNKVLNGNMSNFDFIIEFSDINSPELIDVFISEVRNMYETAYMFHSLDYAYDGDGNVVDILETSEPYYPIHIESLKMIIDHFEKQISKDTLNRSNTETYTDIEPSFNVDTSEKSERNPNHFNRECYNLFLYLVENYNKRDKIKFINIFYYLTYYVDEKIYFFKFTQEKYKEFILNKFSVEPKSFKKNVFDNSSEMYTLSSHEQDFRRQ
ncbi:hypothetical protein [Flavobacterium ammoniigenes]|uniref:hypothetical protein n=1 Tax=Flavobacterium ammoniigenes TaxID=1751095 RepID=UPI001E4BBF4A|nr:hypothetical protein [Flavobacterium ammoniigenes]